MIPWSLVNAICASFMTQRWIHMLEKLILTFPESTFAAPYLSGTLGESRYHSAASTFLLMTNSLELWIGGGPVHDQFETKCWLTVNVWYAHRQVAGEILPIKLRFPLLSIFILNPHILLTQPFLPLSTN